MKERVLRPIGRIGWVQIDCPDPERLAAFWAEILGVESFLYVEKLQQRGIDAVALSGISGRLLVAKKKDVRAVKDGKTLLLRDDYTGKVEAVNLPLLTQFIGPGRVPVIAPLALSIERQALNVDGDRVAAAARAWPTWDTATSRSRRRSQSRPACSRPAPNSSTTTAGPSSTRCSRL